MQLRRQRDPVHVDPAARTASSAGVSATVADPDLVEGAADLVRFLLHCRLREPFYGFWPVRVVDGVVWERDDAFTGWVAGADRAVRARVLQEATCWDLASDLEPPHATASAVVAPGALERDRLVAVRYEYMAPQSGWYFGGEQGKRLPLHAIVARRPDVVAILALEPGWRATLEPAGTRVKRRDD